MKVHNINPLYNSRKTILCKVYCVIDSIILAAPIPIENNSAFVTVTVKSQILEMEKHAEMQSLVIKEMIDYAGENQLSYQVILVNVCSQTLEKVIEYREYHRLNSSQMSDLTKAWDLNFISNVNIRTILDLMKVI